MKQLTLEQADRARGVLLGLACGDALGAGYEFQAPVPWDLEISMIGGGVFGWKPGEWTDDTSQAIILNAMCGKFQNMLGTAPLDASSRSIVDWALQAPDVGTQTREVIFLAEEISSGSPITWEFMNQASNAYTRDNPLSSGNGSLMRIAGVYPVALALLNEFHKLGGKGVAAPSANRFGAVSPTTAQAVDQELHDYLEEGDLILDGGPSLVGVESTIIDCTGDAPRILRLGAVTAEMIQESTGLETSYTNPNAIKASGTLEAHYQPKAKVLLDVIAEAGDGLIAPDQIPTPDGVIRLASPFTIEQYARDLYAALRLADEKGLEIVVVLQPGGDGLAAAIRDRLQRAAFH